MEGRKVLMIEKSAQRGAEAGTVLQPREHSLAIQRASLRAGGSNRRKKLKQQVKA